MITLTYVVQGAAVLMMAATTILMAAAIYKHVYRYVVLHLMLLAVNGCCIVLMSLLRLGVSP